MTGWQIENVFLYAIVAALVAGLFYMSSSWHSLWGLLMLAFVTMKGPVP